MAQAVDSITTRALALALDAASLRQQAISANIANAETVGYVPLAVDFEAQLGNARRSLASQGHLDAHSLDGVVPRLVETDEIGSSGLSTGVTLDVQVARMAENAVRYETLLKGLSRHFGVLSEAIADGKK